jgi:HEPN domain-containing protein
MNQKEIVAYWRVEADEALKVAYHLFEKRDYSYALFFGHLAVEKILKALFVKNVGLNVPRTHNLLRLAKATRIPVNEEKEYELVRITAFNLEARYPDYKRAFRKKCTAEFSTKEINTIQEVFSWLKSMLES